ncbi:MAG: CoA transferase [Gammaproteobacteria bacterium]|nr:CoA transferase [Gammaproteobacteria bacterium]
MNQNDDRFSAGQPSGSLTGVRVVDLTTVMFGPFATQTLGEMGAEVFKIEAPEGDIGRYTGAARSHGMSAAHLTKGRNKRSVAIDLKSEEGLEVLRRLTRGCDVFVHNMRPQATRRLGIDYESVRGWREDIVYAAAVGFGEAGPYAERPAYDDLIQGMSGMAGLYGMATGEPRYAPTVMADKTSGLYLLWAISMALFHRQRSGQGQKVVVPMFECMSSFLMNEHLQGRTFEPPTGPAGYQRLLTPHRRPHRTADGYICLMPYNNRHWARFFQIIGSPELADDPRFNEQSARSKHIDTLYGIVAESMRARTTAQWLEVLSEADIPCGPMNEPEDLFEDPHLQAVQMFPHVEHPSEGPMRHIGVPVSFSATPGGLHHHAEPLGQSSRQVLEELGYASDEIEALIERRVVRSAAS